MVADNWLLGTEYGDTTAPPRVDTAVDVTVAQGVVAIHVVVLVGEEATVPGPDPIRGPAHDHLDLARVPLTAGKSRSVSGSPTRSWRSFSDRTVVMGVVVARSLPGSLAIARPRPRLKTESGPVTNQDQGHLVEGKDLMVAQGAAVRRSVQVVRGTAASFVRENPNREKPTGRSLVVPGAVADLGIVALEAAVPSAPMTVSRKNVEVRALRKMWRSATAAASRCQVLTLRAPRGVILNVDEITVHVGVRVVEMAMTGRGVLHVIGVRAVGRVLAERRVRNPQQV